MQWMSDQTELRRLRAIVHLTTERPLCDAEETRKRMRMAYEYAICIAHTNLWSQYGECITCGFAAPHSKNWIMICANHNNCSNAYCKLHLPQGAITADFWIFPNGHAQRKESDSSFIVCEECQLDPVVQNHIRDYS